MKTTAIIEGLTILEKYRDNVDGYDTGTDHDHIYAYRTDQPVDSEDLARLIVLGWIQEVNYCGERDFAAKHYVPEEDWCCFV